MRSASLTARIVVSLSIAGCASTPTRTQGDAARDQVFQSERAFAKTMVERDLKAFSQFVSDEAIFISAAGPLRGKQAVIEHWSRLYAEPEAPFTWEPTRVEVLAGGTLALSSGPVHDAAGKLIGCYNTVWRQEAAGEWRIVFDKGNAPGGCERK